VLNLAAGQLLVKKLNVIYILNQKKFNNWKNKNKSNKIGINSQQANNLALQILIKKLQKILLIKYLETIPIWEEFIQIYQLERYFRHKQLE